jgi:hypothetical protein
LQLQLFCSPGDDHTLMRLTSLRLAALALVWLASIAQPADRAASSITVSLLDDRDSITNVMSPELLLELRGFGPKARQGWEVRVLKRPAGFGSRNLIHSAPHGPDPSDAAAWQVAGHFFPNERVMDVRGYPFTVTIRLIDPVTTGQGPDATFVSGSLRVSWRRRR